MDAQATPLPYARKPALAIPRAPPSCLHGPYLVAGPPLPPPHCPNRSSTPAPKSLSDDTWSGTKSHKSVSDSQLKNLGRCSSKGFLQRGHYINVGCVLFIVRFLIGSPTASSLSMKVSASCASIPAAHVVKMSKHNLLTAKNSKKLTETNPQKRCLPPTQGLGNACDKFRHLV